MNYRRIALWIVLYKTIFHNKSMSKFRFRKAIPKTPLPFFKLLPCIITLLSLIIGLSSIRFAFEERFELAVECILIAAILDGIDGRMARILNATSSFGAELDSLCDFINFGVAPGIIIYIWTLQYLQYKLLGWYGVLLFTVCSAIRLARFNTSLAQPRNDTLSKYFFMGIPAPAGALLALMPLVLEFDIAKLIPITIVNNRYIILLYLVLVGFLTASRLPTISMKYIKIRPEFIWISLFGIMTLLIMLTIYTWYTLPMLGVIYYASIPITVIVARRIN